MRSIRQAHPSALIARACRFTEQPSCYLPLWQQRFLNTTAAKDATPLPHPPVPGPIPKPPTPSASQEDDRVSRRKKQAELVEKGKTIRANEAKPGAALQKRFWKNVSVQETPEGYQIHLDTRPLRTPSTGVLAVPLSKPHLASAIALEWDLLVSAQQALKQQYIPLTVLSARAIDITRGDASNNPKARNNAVDMLMRYLSTDTLLCWAPVKTVHNAFSDAAPGRVVASRSDAASGPATSSAEQPKTTLRELQKATAEPIVEYLRTHVWPGLDINADVLGEDSIMPQEQPEATKAIIRGWLSGLPAWELAALERATLASKSLLIGVRLLVEWGERWRASTEEVEAGDETKSTGKFSVEDAANACSLEVRWQTGMWGEVEDTHDVEREDVRRQLGSVIFLIGEKLM